VFSILQRVGVVYENGQLQKFYPPDYDLDSKDPYENGFIFRGGCTLIFDLDSLQLKYAISKPLLDSDALEKEDALSINLKRLNAQYAFQNGDEDSGINQFELYFGNGINHTIEPFAFLHQH
jgi:lipopolysaccharide assembly outer membrane protein LptD (OstA)